MSSCRSGGACCSTSASSRSESGSTPGGSHIADAAPPSTRWTVPCAKPLPPNALIVSGMIARYVAGFGYAHRAIGSVLNASVITSMTACCSRTLTARTSTVDIPYLLPANDATASSIGTTDDDRVTPDLLALELTSPRESLQCMVNDGADATRRVRAGRPARHSPPQRRHV